MSGFLMRRLASAALAAWLILTVIFVMIQAAPGGPAAALAGDYATRETQEALIQAYQLDSSPLHQYTAFMGAFVTGEWGYSYHFKRPVIKVIAERLPATLLLLVPGLALAIGLGTLMGALIADRAGQRQRAAIVGTVYAMYAIPIFWLGQLLVLLLAVELGWFPVQGMRDPRTPVVGLAAAADITHHLLLPLVTLALHQGALFLGLAESRVREELAQEHVRFARALGLPQRIVLFRHALRVALGPIVAAAASRAGMICAGAVLVETLFAWPGLGRLVTAASLSRDYPLLLGLFTLVTFAVLSANLIGDVIMAWLDPRVRLHRAALAS